MDNALTTQEGRTKNPFGDIGRFFSSLTTQQLLLLGGSAVLVGGLLWGFVSYIDKPDYKVLITKLNPSDLQTLGGRLAAKNIPYQTTPDGAGIEVPSDSLDQARLEIASGPTMGGGRLGFEIFDKPNLASSDFDEQVNYQRALEGELERTIETISEVDSVRVHITPAKDSLFTENQQEAKAAVVLKLKSPLPTQAGGAITQLVASAVEGLRPENVRIVDSDGHLLRTGLSGTGEDADSGEEETALEQRLTATLEPIAGTNRVRATVRVERETATTEDTKETYDPNSAVAVTMQKSDQRMGDVIAAGIPGTTSNVPGANTTGTPSTSSNSNGEVMHTENGTYAVNRTVHHVMQPPGAVKKLSVAVLVDDAGDADKRRKRTPEELQQIEQLARASLGIDDTRGDKIAVTNLPFETITPEQPQPQPITAQVAAQIRPWNFLLRYVAMGLLFIVVYFALLRPVKKQVLVTMKEIRERPAQIAVTQPSALPGPDLHGGATMNLRKELAERVKREPEVASKVIQNWVREGA